MKAKSFFLKFAVLGVSFMSLFSGCYGFTRDQARELGGYVKQGRSPGDILYDLAARVEENCRWYVGRNRHYCAGQAEFFALIANRYGVIPDSSVAGALAGIRGVREYRQNNP